MNLQDILQNIEVPGLWWSRNGIPGIIQADGQEVLDLIHRLSTNGCLNLQSQMGKQTILTNEKGRIIDVITVINRIDHTLILTSPGNEQQVISWLKKYIIMENIRFTIMTNDVEMVTIHGPESLDFVSQFIRGDLLTLPMHSAISKSDSNRFAIRSMPIHELQFLIIDQKENGLLDYFSSQKDIPELFSNDWNRERILAGQGIYSHEWSDAYNPLEAGLLHLIDFKKGCYIGQEVIARLDSYNKVNKRLMGISSQSHFEEHDLIYVEDEQIGVITSISSLEDMTIALGYVRSEHSYDETNIKIQHQGKSVDAVLHVLPMRG
jgi:folate-binding protein YgfZ